MKITEPCARVAIVGFGPRGLGALESLMMSEIGKRAKFCVDIFDPFHWPGAGPNYDPDQSELCILNIPLRSLSIDPPGFLAGNIGTFSDWSQMPFEPEEFPPRAHLGAYFNARFNALKDVKEYTATIKYEPEQITGIQRIDSYWWLTTANAKHGPYDEVLLTQGQPKTAPDPQLKRWTDHAKKHDLELLSAYPANELINAAEHWADKTVAIRGLGLSTFDVLRMLTSGLGGTFDGQTYIPSGNEPHKILPFSLNGLPPAPKPANIAVDQSFDPTDEETRLYQKALNSALTEPSNDALKIICGALVGPASRILANLGSDSTEVEVRLWLDAERDDPGSQEYLGALDTLEIGIEMAHGRTPPSVGYTVSQFWRKWEGLTRSAFNKAKLDPEISSEIVNFDESLKRYSAGPPVSASEELLALIESRVVSLCTVDDPDITLSSDGWHLIEEDDTATASVLIDAVLPTPDVERVTDHLVATVLKKGFGQQLSQGRGLITSKNGQLYDRKGEIQKGLCALGRLALGSVIAVDSLHDCFGDTTTRWADGVIDRAEGKSSQG